MIKLVDLLRFACQHKASDLRLSPHYPPWLRVAGNWCALAEKPLTAETIMTLIFSVLSAPQREHVRATTVWPLWFGIEVPLVGRLRLALYPHTVGISAVFRFVPYPPDPTTFSLPNTFWELLEQSGLVLIQGARGSGRSTTASAFIRYLVQQGSYHIMTLESPIEVRYRCATSEDAMSADPKGAPHNVSPHCATEDTTDHNSKAVQPQAIALKNSSSHCHTQAVVEQHTVNDAVACVTLLQTLARAAFDVVYVDHLSDAAVLSAAMDCVVAGMTVIATGIGRSFEQGLQVLVDLFPVHERQCAQRRLADSLNLVLHQTLQYQPSQNPALSPIPPQNHAEHVSPSSEQHSQRLCYHALRIEADHRALIATGDFDQLLGMKYGEVPLP